MGAETGVNNELIRNSGFAESDGRRGWFGAGFMDPRRGCGNFLIGSVVILVPVTILSNGSLLFCTNLCYPITIQAYCKS